MATSSQSYEGNSPKTLMFVAQVVNKNLPIRDWTYNKQTYVTQNNLSYTFPYTFQSYRTVKWGQSPPAGAPQFFLAALKITLQGNKVF